MITVYLTNFVNYCVFLPQVYFYTLLLYTRNPKMSSITVKFVNNSHAPANNIWLSLQPKLPSNIFRHFAL